MNVKLVTKEIAKTDVFRKRLLELLEKRILEWTLETQNPNSVDRVDRVTHVDFLSVPRIDCVSSQGDRAEGSIRVELILETQVHSMENEETVTDTKTTIVNFVADVDGKRAEHSTKIENLRLTLRDCSIR